jgi:hypothetical protein
VGIISDVLTCSLDLEFCDVFSELLDLGFEGFYLLLSLFYIYLVELDIDIFPIIPKFPGIDLPIFDNNIINFIIKLEQSFLYIVNTF